MATCMYTSNFLYIVLNYSNIYKVSLRLHRLPFNLSFQSPEKKMKLLPIIVLTFLGLIAVAQGKTTHYSNRKTRSTQPHK